MTFVDYLRQKSGSIVGVIIYGMSEWVEPHDGRMMLTGKMQVYDDFVTITSVDGDVSAVQTRFIINMDWSADDQVDLENLTIDDIIRGG